MWKVSTWGSSYFRMLTTVCRFTQVHGLRDNSYPSKHIAKFWAPSPNFCTKPHPKVEFTKAPFIFLWSVEMNRWKSSNSGTLTKLISTWDTKGYIINEVSREPSTEFWGQPWDILNWPIQGIHNKMAKHNPSRAHTSCIAHTEALPSDFFDWRNLVQFHLP